MCVVVVVVVVVVPPTAVIFVTVCLLVFVRLGVVALTSAALDFDAAVPDINVEFARTRGASTA